VIKHSARQARFVIAGLAGIAIFVLLAILSSTRSVLLRASAHVTSTTTATPQSECECKDLVALVSRRHEVHAAIDAIDKQQAQLESDERQAGKVFPYSDRDYALYFSNWIQMAVEAAHDKTTPQVHGPTNFTSDCSPTTSSGDNPSCFWQGLAINEQVRSKWCQAKLRGGGDIIRQTIGGSWMTRYPIADFAAVAKKGYEAELAHLEETIRNLRSRCKFSKWSGEVTVTYTSQTIIKESSPKPGTPSVPHQNHGTEDTTIKESETVVITLVDGYALAEGGADYSKYKESHSGPEIWCHASTQKNAFVPWSRTATETYKISGAVSHGASVSVGWPGDGSYKVSAHLPTGMASGDSSMDAAETGECAAKPVHNHYPVTNKSVGGFSVTGKGRAQLNDLVLDGRDQPKPPVVANGTETTMTIEWHLRRSQAK